MAMTLGKWNAILLKYFLLLIVYINMKRKYNDDPLVDSSAQ